MFRNRSVDVHQFAMVPKADVPRSAFNRQCTHKTTFDAGYLVPVFVDEVLPGDTFKLKMTAFARLATPLYPVMDNLHLDSFFFFVPCRLLWTNWVKMMGEQTNPGDSISYAVPQQVSPNGGYAINSLQDYFGLPTVGQVGAGVGVSHNALPLRAYNLIYKEWFRDENLINSPVVDTGDGPDNVANYTLLRRGKRHDYFTSALPWPQRERLCLSPSVLQRLYLALARRSALQSMVLTATVPVTTQAMLSVSMLRTSMPTSAQQTRVDNLQSVKLSEL